MKPASYLLLFAFLLGTLQASGQSARTTPSSSAPAGSLTHFSNWLAGEYNNNEQVWQQLQDAQKTATGIPENPFAHLHYLITPVSPKALGKDVFLVRVQQLADGAKREAGKKDSEEANKIVQLVLYRLSQATNTGASPNAPIRAELFSFNDEAKFADLHLNPTLQNSLTMKDLRPMTGCDISWRYQADQARYQGSTGKDSCKIVSKENKKTLVLNNSFELSATEFWANEQATDSKGQRVRGRVDNQASKSRKLRYFTGWAYINRSGRDAGPLATKFSFQKSMLMHNEGQRVALVYDDGRASGYSVELAQLTYQETRTPILKLALIDDATNKSITYIWADIDATRIGMNLQWLQVGLTVKPERSAFGFDPAVQK